MKTKITDEMVEHWLGSDVKHKDILEILTDIANGDYKPKMLWEDIASIWEEPVFAMCDGDCGGSYNVEDLHTAETIAQYKFCRPCMFEFVADQEQEWGEE